MLFGQAVDCLFQLLNIVLVIFKLVCKKAHYTSSHIAGVYGCSSFLPEMSDDFIALIVIRTLQINVCCGSCRLMSDPYIGVRDAVAKETDFELRGFILVMLAAVMSGFRWTVTQLLLQVVS